MRYALFGKSARLFQKTMIGTRLTHYEITAHLGSGGMGEVYRAAIRRLDEALLLKHCPKPLRVMASVSRDSNEKPESRRENYAKNQCRGPKIFLSEGGNNSY